ncbi:MAG: hypothetical protein FJ271_11875 [Planctomycetes bacterium]|nr:hypothetical protein [Planctomycetota bacterium]
MFLDELARNAIVDVERFYSPVADMMAEQESMLRSVRNTIGNVERFSSPFAGILAQRESTLRSIRNSLGGLLAKEDRTRQATAAALRRVEGEPDFQEYHGYYITLEAAGTGWKVIGTCCGSEKDLVGVFASRHEAIARTKKAIDSLEGFQIV